MGILYIIVIAILFGWWLCTSDLPYSISSIVATRSMKMYTVAGILFLFTIIGGVFLAEPFSISIEQNTLLTTPVSSVVIVSSAFLTVLLTYRISSFSSFIYAVMASLISWKFFEYNQFDYWFLIKNFAVWIAAPILAAFISFYITILYKRYIVKSNLSFFHLIYYLRFGIIVGTMVYAFLLGINNGAVLIALNNTVKPNFSLFFDQVSLNTDATIYIFSVIIIAATTFYFTGRKILIYSQNGVNSGTESVLLIITAANLVLLLFSLPFMEVPVSAAQLIFGASIGNLMTRKNISIDISKIYQLITVNAANLIIAFLLTYSILSTINQKYLQAENTSEILQGKSSIINVTIPVILTAIIIILIILLLYFVRENRQKLQAQKETLKHKETLFENEKSLSAMEVKTILLENTNLNTKLELKRQELTNIALNISEQKSFLEHIYNELKNIRETSATYDKNKKTEKLEKEILQKMNFSHEIESFYSEIETLHKDFNIRLSEVHPNLTENDKRLITLLRLGFSTKHISSLTNISPKSVEISRYRLRNKLGLSHDQKLILYLKSL